MLYNALIQPYFDYNCPAWHPNLTMKLKNRIQTSQSKSIRFCLQLYKVTHTSYKKTETLNCLPVTERSSQCINSIVFRYLNDHFPNYLNEAFQIATENNIQNRGSFQKLNCSFRKTNASQMALPCIGPTIWIKILETLKWEKSLKGISWYQLNDSKFYL